MNSNIIPNLITGTPVGISIYSVTQEKCHYHEGFLEIIYCLKGNSVIHIAYEDIQLCEGDIISCDPHDIHALSSSEDNLFVSFYFDLKDPMFKNPDLQYVFFVCERYVLKKESQNEMQYLKHLLLTLLYFYCFPHPKVSQKETFGTLTKRIIDIMTSYFHFFNYLFTENHYNEEAKSRFEKIIIYINKHYNEKLTIEKLSAIVHLNANYLSQFFKKTSLLGFSNMLTFIRIYQSEKLLLDSNKNIADISYDTGFSDPKFYYKNFKKWYNHTPLKQRNFFKETAAKSTENRFYNAQDISDMLKHYISYYFATLHIPEFWNVPCIPFRNVPLE